MQYSYSKKMLLTTSANLYFATMLDPYPDPNFLLKFMQSSKLCEKAQFVLLGASFAIPIAPSKQHRSQEGGAPKS